MSQVIAADPSQPPETRLRSSEPGPDMEPPSGQPSLENESRPSGPHDTTGIGSSRGAAHRWTAGLLGLALAVGLLGTGAALQPFPALAGGSCTGWTSTIVPPDAIRVLRQDGKVETVNFKRYVRKVMASGEWPYHLPRALLRAGAQATKQFAWYHSLKGNHRSGFVTSSGKCYDVVATSLDQIYKPGATVHYRQKRAVDAIWDLSLHRNNRFILTQYRSGKKVGCAADVDGRRLYARSAKRCAKLGWSARRILRTYYSGDNTVALVSSPIGFAVAWDIGLAEEGAVEPSARAGSSADSLSASGASYCAACLIERPLWRMLR